jgi:hypothetical protein
VKHKQEVASLKQELAKLQQESKMGSKSKDLTAKDLEAARKKLAEVEAKLKVAVSDKQAAVQVRVVRWRLGGLARFGGGSTAGDDCAGRVQWRAGGAHALTLWRAHDRRTRPTWSAS